MDWIIDESFLTDSRMNIINNIDYNNTEKEHEYMKAMLQIQALTQLYRNVYDCQIATSGGVQQYLNNLKIKGACEQETGCNLVCKTSVMFDALPVYVKLKIFSYLPITDLSRVASVSKDWFVLSSDNVLWQKLLDRDSHTWNVIGWNSNPLLYAQLLSDWTQKDIYLQCCPEVRKCRNQHSYLYTSLSTLFRSVLPKTTPRVAMFGPGMESSTSGIVRHILYDDNDTFTRIKMFPGLFGGLGSGFTLRLANRLVDLMVLYSAPKKERTAVNRTSNRMERNRLIRPTDVDLENGHARTYELTQSVCDLCHTLDAFIYVVDADASKGDCSNDELMAMCSERWSAVQLPVVVLSCVRDTTVSRRSCIDVVTLLDMSTLNRPWQVHDVEVSSLAGVGEAFTWLIEQAERR